MGTTFLAADLLFAPLQRLARWLGRSLAAAPGRGEAHAPAARPPCAPAAVRQPTAPHAVRTARLRVVRIFEGPQPAAGAGRMVISGRMADVCAELERLAALETAAG